jgi:DNA uptake protein ComE-like DNA-binding protein
VAGAFHGEVTDINNAGAPAIARLPGLSPEIAARIVSVRTRIGGFTSAADLGMVLDLPSDTVERLRDLAVFLPLQESPRFDVDDDLPAGTPASIGSA